LPNFRHPYGGANNSVTSAERLGLRLMRRKWIAIILVVGISAVSGLAFALTSTPLSAQFTKEIEAQIPLLLTVGALVLLIVSAILALVYGFSMEGKLGRPYKHKRRDNDQ
jgi:hypothetical protein